MPRRGRHRKKTRTHVVETENAATTLKSKEELKVPKSLVIRRGKVEDEVSDLERDLRKMMMPYTAVKFKEDARNRKATLSVYAKSVGPALGVTHILALSQNGPQVNLRLGRVPSGPTLTFKVQRFGLARQVRSVQRRPYESESAYRHPPVVVTNNFGDASTAPPHVKLMRITFQALFPAVNVATVRLADCRRVVLFNYVKGGNKRTARKETGDGEEDDGGKEGGDGEAEEEEDVVEVRHYAIRANPVGVNRKVRRIIRTKIPDLSKLDDVADYITGRTASGAPSGYASSGNASDSEPEDETSHVVLSQRYSGRGNAPSQKSALKLVEIGPRMRLRLFKVQRGLDAGDVMYHAYVKKTQREAKEQRESVRRKEEEKRRRREVQEENVRRKREAAEEKREAKRRRKEERERVAMEELRRGGGGGLDREEGADGGESSPEEEEEGGGDTTASGSEAESDEE